MPVYYFRARRRCERAFVIVVFFVFREEFCEIDFAFGFFLAFFSREILQVSFKEFIFRTFLKHHAKNCKIRVGIFVYEVDFKRELFAVDGVFAGGVIVKLEQFIFLVADGYFVIASCVELYRVAVVNNICIGFTVGKFERRETFTVLCVFFVTMSIGD